MPFTVNVTPCFNAPLTNLARTLSQLLQQKHNKTQPTSDNEDACSVCRKQSKTESCSVCSHPTCSSCVILCENPSCGNSSCNFCTVVNYDLLHDRTFCLYCEDEISKSQNKENSK